MGVIQKTISKFPIAEAVPNCLLQKFQAVRKGEDNMVLISFSHEGTTLSEWVKIPKRSNFNTKKEFESERLRVKKFIESILYAYIDGHTMAEIIRECNNSFDEYIELAIKALKNEGAFEAPVILKTVPKKNGEAKLPRYPFFIKKPEDDRFRLTPYNAYEQNLFTIK